MTRRPYRPSADREEVLALFGGDSRVIDSPGQRIHVATNAAGAIIGAVVWIDMGKEHGGWLANVVLGRGATIADIYRLALSACEDAIALEQTQGRFIIRSRALLAILQRDFKIDAKPSSWEPTTGTPVEWEVWVDLAGARAQLTARGVT